MTKEELFDRVVRERIAIAIGKTGHTFFGLLKALDEKDAVSVARRFISPEYRQTFQDGLRELRRAGLLHLSVEQTIIDFHGRGFIFTAAEAQTARDRLRLVELLLH